MTMSERLLAAGGRYAVLFVGYSLTNTPKVFRVQKTLSAYGDTRVLGVVKRDTLQQDGVAYRDIDAPRSWRKMLRLAAGLVWMLRSLLAQRPTLIYAVNPLAGAVAWCVHKLRGTPYVYETHEIFVGTRFPILSGPFRPLLKAVERRVMLDASLNFATDAWRAKFLRRYLKLGAATPLHWLLNVPTQADFPRRNKEPDPQDLPIVSYCGGVTPDRQIATLIGAAAKVRQQREFRLIIAGSIEPDYRTSLERLIFELNAQSWISLLGAMPNDRLMQVMAQSAVTVAFYERDCVNNRLCSPNKFFDALHAGVMLLCSRSPLGRHVVEHHGWGQCCDAEREEDVIRGLETCLDKASALLGNRQGLANLQARYSWEAEAAKLVNLLASHT